MTWGKPFALAIVVALMVSIGMAGMCRVAFGIIATPVAVSLPEARHAPDVLRYVKAGHTRTVQRSCVLSDVSAYRWSGRALGAQYDAPNGRSYWGDVRHGGAVVWVRSSRTFINRTTRPVLVAGWCG